MRAELNGKKTPKRTRIGFIVLGTRPFFSRHTRLLLQYYTSVRGIRVFESIRMRQNVFFTAAVRAKPFDYRP